MKFLITGGNATEDLEASEEIFDAMTVAVEMLVKGGFLRSAGVYGYDGDAAELVHISTDGVAVVALVHEGEGLRTKVGLEQRLALVEVGDVGAGKDEAHRVAQ